VKGMTLGNKGRNFRDAAKEKGGTKETEVGEQITEKKVSEKKNEQQPRKEEHKELSRGGGACEPQESAAVGVHQHQRKHRSIEKVISRCKKLAGSTEGQRIFGETGQERRHKSAPKESWTEQAKEITADEKGEGDVGGGPKKKGGGNAKFEDRYWPVVLKDKGGF